MIWDDISRSEGGDLLVILFALAEFIDRIPKHVTTAPDGLDVFFAAGASGQLLALRRDLDGLLARKDRRVEAPPYPDHWLGTEVPATTAPRPLIPQQGTFWARLGMSQVVKGCRTPEQAAFATAHHRAELAAGPAGVGVNHASKVHFRPVSLTLAIRGETDLKR